jgi:hypothetical protein
VCSAGGQRVKGGEEQRKVCEEQRQRGEEQRKVCEEQRQGGEEKRQMGERYTNKNELLCSSVFSRISGAM